MIGHRTAYTYSGNSDQKLAYNANDLVRSATLNKEVQDGKSVQYGYDRVGNPTSIRYPNQRLVEREFDLLNRISRVKQGNDIVSTMEFLGRSYRLASKGYQNGDLVKYLYDQGRRLTSSETKNKNQAILQSFGWGYDSLDLKSFEKRIHDGGKGDIFSYDALKRLTNVTFDSPTPETPTATGTKSRSMTLDKLDNILKITDNESGMLTEIVGELEGKGKVLNQYSRFNDLPLEHDRNGNLSAKGSRLFTYDYKNRLIRSSKGDDAVTFTYDIFGRQTSRTDLSGTQRYFYAGDQKIEERNASGQVTKHYLWGNSIDELLRLDIYNGNVAKPYYVHTDSIGSTTTVTDENGNVVERVRYDAYGVPSFTDALGQSLKKSTIGNTTLFQGREYDYDLALYNYRARYFDPTLGRFLQTDPLGYQDSMNLYQGMNMNPGNFVDPWGEYGIDFHYYVIYFLMRSKGWGNENANAIASFSQYVDDDSITDWIAKDLSKVNYFHFPGANETGKAVRGWYKTTEHLKTAVNEYSKNQDRYNSVLVGALLHSYADSWAHNGFNAKSGGHAFLGHTPDIISRSPESINKALDCAKNIYYILPEGREKIVGWYDVEKQLRYAFSIYNDLKEKGKLANIYGDFWSGPTFWVSKAMKHLIKNSYKCNANYCLDSMKIIRKEFITTLSFFDYY